MANQFVKQDLVEVLETIVDKHELLHVMTALECMCSEKAMHIEMNWQDKRLAREWNRAANALTTAVNKIGQLEL